MTPEELLMLLQKSQQPTTMAVERIEGRLEHIDTKISSIDARVENGEGRLLTIEARMTAWEQKLEERIQAELARRLPTPAAPSTAAESSASSSRTTASTRSSGPSEAWKPQALVVRGWAPHGSQPSARITRAEAYQLAASITDRLPEHAKKELLLQQPYTANYQLVFKIRPPGDVWLLRDLLSQIAETHSLSVKDIPIKIAVEVSPERRRQYAQFFNEKRKLEAASPFEGVKWQMDIRQLTILSMDLFTIGHLQRDGTFEWAEDQLLLLELEKTPNGDLRRQRKRTAEADADRNGDADADTVDIDM